jgi:hypothetical protein
VNEEKSFQLLASNILRKNKTSKETQSELIIQISKEIRILIKAILV